MILSDFYFAHPQVFLVPIEHLTNAGISQPFARLLRDERDVSDAWLALFDQAMSLYWSRVTSLAERAPKYWRAPRLANVCVVRDALGTRPYYQPFSKSTWLVYESDFDPERSTVEHATYQLVHSERLGTTGNVGMTAVHNLSYFVALTADERQNFRTGCERSARPDRDGFAALADLMDVVDSLCHDQLRPQTQPSDKATARIELAGLTVPAVHRPAIQALPGAMLNAANASLRNYFQHQKQVEPGADADPATTLTQWLKDTTPRVLIVDHLGGTLWDPDQPRQTDALAGVLHGLPHRAARSLAQDWTVIDHHTRAFLKAVVQPDDLGLPTDALEQEGGIYIHDKRRLIAYCMVQPGLKTLAEEAPPYHRLLVGARTIHEWAHLAVDAGMVAVPDDRSEDHERAYRHLRRLFDDLVASAPAAYRDAARGEVDALRREGYALADMPLQRMSDYQANLLARSFLSDAEMEAYVRANVRPLIDEENIGPYLRIARHAYEYQYLRLSRIEDPFHYFMASTWFARQFFDTGIIDEAGTRALLDAVTDLCKCYRVDRSRVVLPREVDA